MKEVLIIIVAGDHEITQRVQQIVGYMKMRGMLSIVPICNLSTSNLNSFTPFPSFTA